MLFINLTVEISLTVILRENDYPFISIFGKFKIRLSKRMFE